MTNENLFVYVLRNERFTWVTVHSGDMGNTFD